MPNCAVVESTQNVSGLPEKLQHWLLFGSLQSDICLQSWRTCIPMHDESRFVAQAAAVVQATVVAVALHGKLPPLTETVAQQTGVVPMQPAGPSHGAPPSPPLLDPELEPELDPELEPDEEPDPEPEDEPELEPEEDPDPDPDEDPEPDDDPELDPLAESLPESAPPLPPVLLLPLLHPAATLDATTTSTMMDLRRDGMAVI